MLTGNSLLNTLVDELNELGLPNMAAELDRLYAAPGFLEMDHLTGWGISTVKNYLRVFRHRSSLIMVNTSGRCQGCLNRIF